MYSRSVLSISYFTSQNWNDVYLHSFLPSAVKLWNNVPQSSIKIDNINDFKQELEHFLISHPLYGYLYLYALLHSNK